MFPSHTLCPITHYYVQNFQITTPKNLTRSKISVSAYTWCVAWRHFMHRQAAHTNSRFCPDFPTPARTPNPNSSIQHIFWHILMVLTKFQSSCSFQIKSFPWKQYTNHNRGHNYTSPIPTWTLIPQSCKDSYNYPNSYNLKHVNT